MLEDLSADSLLQYTIKKVTVAYPTVMNFAVLCRSIKRICSHVVRDIGLRISYSEVRLMTSLELLTRYSFSVT